jgi:hypothetical protein
VDNNNWDEKRLPGEVEEHVFWTSAAFQGQNDPEWDNLRAAIQSQVDDIMKKAFNSEGVVRLRAARRNC